MHRLPVARWWCAGGWREVKRCNQCQVACMAGTARVGAGDHAVGPAVGAEVIYESGVVLGG